MKKQLEIEVDLCAEEEMPIRKALERIEDEGDEAIKVCSECFGEGYATFQDFDNVYQRKCPYC